MNLNLVSKHRGPIYGFSILWIVIFHAKAIDNCDLSFGMESLEYLKWFLATGNVGVDIFLFLSGICLYFSFVKQPDYQKFIVKRLKRVVLPALLVYSLYWLIRFWVIGGNPVDFFSRMTLMRFWLTGDSVIWFISLILVLYVLYPYIYQAMFNGTHTLARCLVVIGSVIAVVWMFSVVNPELFDMVEIAVCRIPVFLIGCAMGKLVHEKRTANPVWAFVSILLFFGSIYLLRNNYIQGTVEFRYVQGICGIGGTYTLALAAEGVSKLGTIGNKCNELLSKPGDWSLELYCTHIMLNQIYQLSPLYVDGSIKRYLVVAASAILLAWLVKKAEDAILKAWDLRKQKSA